MTTRKNPPAKWVLPSVVDPPKRRCYVIQVPDEIQHIGAFFGALYNLTSARFWQDDIAHTAKEVAAVWQDIYDEILRQDCNPVICPVPIAESDYDMSICEQLRFHEGTLQALCCGVWTDISGQLPGQGIGSPGQPGPGTGVPPAGGFCQIYHGLMGAKDQWLAPPVVNSGDTIQFSNIQGAWSDGAGLWYCPAGGLFFAGACTIGTRDALDPIPTSDHMVLLAKIAGSYYDVSAGGLFTVPGGVTNALLIVQANDANLADNFGQISFDVQVCNNQTAGWSSFIDFSLVAYGGSQPGAGNPINWLPGRGWNFPLPVDSGGMAWEQLFATPTVITSIQIVTDTNTLILPGGSNLARLFIPGTFPIANPWLAAGTSTQTASYANAVGESGVTGINCTMSGAGAPDGSGTVILKSMAITGKGTKPPELP